ncbi:MAG TPA: phosphoribosylanthranilate isomerase [Candidatus Altiarchaeales archaeon]|nr:phosphoribosylanthranilate isomerase [Candidatus Altiarchaeales archaeon]
MTKVKICGITNKEDAVMVAKSGADFIGIINVRDSPRYVNLETVREIFNEVPDFTYKVIVSTPRNIDAIREIERINPDYIQLHGDETIDFVRKIKEEIKTGIIKKISVDKNAIEKAREFSGIVDAILLDTKMKGMVGGTGKTHNWNISRKIVELVEKPVILAGGLNPENVGEAIEQVKPYAVDVSSGVESMTGKKDMKRVEDFIMNAKELK